MSAPRRSRSWSISSLASSLWRKAVQGPSSTGPARRRPLGIECLEDRMVPAHLNLAVNSTLDLINPNDSLLSLREAVIAANANADGATISLPAGTHILVTVQQRLNITRS